MKKEAVISGGISRRQLIKEGFYGAALLSFGGLNSCSTLLKGGFGDDTEIQSPILGSKNGLLDIKLELSYARTRIPQWDVNGDRLDDVIAHNRCFHYNGKALVPGPVLSVKPGDLLRLTIVNNLPENTDPMIPENINSPHHLNTTNIHTHGLHVSPSGKQDNVLLEIAPMAEKKKLGARYDGVCGGGFSGEFTYEIKIPENHSSGTFFYHPHKHGSSLEQFLSGMAGAIIVKDREHDLQKFQGIPDKTFIIQRVQQGGDSLNTEFITLNGQIRPQISIAENEVQRWRIIHAGPIRNMEIVLPGLDVFLIAMDGVYLPEMKKIKALNLVSGNRADVIVVGKLSDRKGQLKDQRNDVVLGSLIVTPSAKPGVKMPYQLPNLPAGLETIHENELTNKREISFDDVDIEGESGDFIDQKSFDPSRIDQKIELNSVEEWTIKNNSRKGHPFHIHVNHFQVIEINGSPVKEPIWQDTVNVPGKGGSIKLRTRFKDFKGLTVLHCHNIKHEEAGMMQLIEIV
ncbi:MAG: multicopper oxidase domain-containing protein [Proteobacteria bacterium]|nr:multicopper oxidase domain-containing protein [Pseudomonadota bacterium]